jgi:rhomboid family GlyGly-CTERM serine protease
MRSGLPRVPWVTLLLALPALAAAFSPELAAALQYDRSAVAASQAWRLFTGHWAHWSADHLLWDLLAFAGLGALCELRDRKSLVACLLVAAPAIGLAVHRLQPGLSFYRGLSGLDSALYVLLAASLLIEGWRRRRTLASVAAGLALVLFAAKVLFELGSGEAVFVQGEALDVVVVPLAHVVGALVGVVAAFLSESRLLYCRPCGSLRSASSIACRRPVGRVARRPRRLFSSSP